MAKKEGQSLNAAKEGFFRELYQNLQLIVRLMGDSRVNLPVKLLPVSVLIYWVVPFDFLPLNPLDDALAIWLGYTLFLELCPDDVVAEHRQALRKRSAGQDQTKGTAQEVVDGIYKDVS
jgi:uncharacterized membrane protein YkvA (DUF1232 family)